MAIERDCFDYINAACQVGTMVVTGWTLWHLAKTNKELQQGEDNNRIKAICKAGFRKDGPSHGVVQTAGEALLDTYPGKQALIREAYQELLFEEDPRYPSMSEFNRLMNQKDPKDWPFP